MTTPLDVLLAILQELRTSNTQRQKRLAGESGNTDRGGWSQAGELDPANPGAGVGLAFQMKASQVSTIQFSLLVQPGALQPNATATVRWKCRGNSVTRKVTVGQGSMISGVADAVDVMVNDETAAVYAPGPVPAGVRKYQVVVTCAPLPRPSHASPPSLRHFPGQVNAAPGLTPIPVPQNCGINSAYVSWANLPAGVAMGFAFLANGTVIGTFESSMFAPTYVPMPPGTDTLALVNGAGGAIAAAVNWGIDG